MEITKEDIVANLTRLQGQVDVWQALLKEQEKLDAPTEKDK